MKFFNTAFVTPRLIGWLLFTLMASMLLFWMTPQNAGVIHYKIVLLLIAVVLAYWIDRALFPYARPHELANVCDDDRRLLACWYMMRRAIVVAACVLGLTLGM